MSAGLLQLAMQHHQAGRLAEAEPLYRRILEGEPRNANALYLMGVLASQQGRSADAASWFEKSLAVAGPQALLLNELGKAYVALNRSENAKECFAKAASLQPDFAEAHGNLGAVLAALGERRGAVASLERAAALQPGYPNAHFNLGRTLQELGELEEAERSYRRALALDPSMIDAHFGLGTVLKLALRPDEAEASYRAALALAPSARLEHALAGVLYEQDRTQEAEAAYARAVELDPALFEARWALAVLRMASPAGAGGDANAGPEAQAGLSRLADALEAHPPADPGAAVGTLQPFDLAYREGNHRAVMARYGALCCELMRRWRDQERLPAPAAAPGKRLRVGVVSAHVHDHSVWNAIVRGWIRGLDSERFEVSLFHLGVRSDAATASARASVAHFEHGARPLRGWVDAILARRPDALVYPEIGMDPTTLQLAALRLAPAQLAAWGHPLTTGLPTIDCYLSAQAFEPADAQAGYTERLVALPRLGCSYSAIAGETLDFDRAALGVDPDQALLVCPGTPFKYSPGHDWIYPEIARRLGPGGCRFVFFAQTPRATCEALMRRLERAFAEAGLDYGRFVTFVPVLTRPAFHGLLERADLMLDTLGFSGFNTAMQAIECGLPIVAREGRFMRGRFASGILGRLGMREWVATSDAQYVELAVALARDPEKRRAARARIEASRDVLFDDPAPVRALEELLLELSGARGP